MTRIRLALALALIAVVHLAAQQPQPPGKGRPGGGPRGAEPLVMDDTTGFQPIFDGKTLNGWDGDPAFWKVADGAIVGQSTPENAVKENTFLIWRGGEPADFELKLQFRMNATNSGIQIRSVHLPQGTQMGNQTVQGKWVMKGYQADIDFANTFTGQIYEERGRGFLAMRGQAVYVPDGAGTKPRVIGNLQQNADELKAIIKQNDWNQVHLIARGTTIIQILNGAVTSIVVDEDTKGRSLSGLIGLQLHVGDPMKLEVRNIWLKQAAQTSPPPPQFVSPETLPDQRVVFRIHAPQARAIRLSASDIPGVGRETQLSKGEQDVWEITLGPLEAGAYRYNFNVDGVATIDPRNPAISESNNNVWSLVVVPGSDVFDTRPVPRGAIAEVTYHSKAVGKFRRMHVYTPPGYESGRDRYPVFYLLHGAGDNDDAWSSVGRAGFILDNLIAAKRATPMVVVMPAGHTSRGPGSPIGQAATEEFVADFTTAVMPYIEQHYRVLTDRANTAIAGLSMGGGQTLNVAVPRLERFAYIGVFSSGLIGAFPAAGADARQSATEWEAMHAAKLDDAALKKGLRLLWFATGKEDRLMPTTQATVDLLTKHRFAPVFKQSPGGHTWINWRNYLVEFVPQLFRSAR